jgi:hypothetical protein
MNLLNVPGINFTEPFCWWHLNCHNATPFRSSSKRQNPLLMSSN